MSKKKNVLKMAKKIMSVYYEHSQEVIACAEYILNQKTTAICKHKKLNIAASTCCEKASQDNIILGVTVSCQSCNKQWVLDVVAGCIDAWETDQKVEIPQDILTIADDLTYGVNSDCRKIGSFVLSLKKLVSPRPKNVMVWATGPGNVATQWWAYHGCKGWRGDNVWLGTNSLDLVDHPESDVEEFQKIKETQYE